MSITPRVLFFFSTRSDSSHACVSRADLRMPMHVSLEIGACVSAARRKKNRNEVVVAADDNKALSLSSFDDELPIV